MTRRLFAFLGTCLYIGLHPVWAWYLGGTKRARVLVFNENEKKVLLVRHWLDLRRWDVPGGGQSVGEELKDTASREIKEELELSVSPLSLKELDSIDVRFGLIKFRAHYFEAKIVGNARVNAKWPEILEAEWFSRDEIANLMIHKDVKAIILDCMYNR